MGELTVTLVGNFFLRLAGAATGAMLTQYLSFINREHFAVSATEVGIIAAGFYLAEMVGAPLLGSLSDRRGYRLFMALGPIFGLIAVEMTAVTTSLPILFVTRLLEGLATAAATPALLGYLSARTEGNAELRARVMSLFEVGTVIGISLGFAGGFWFWGQAHREGFFAIGGLYLVSTLLLLRSKETRRAIARRASEPFAILTRLRRIAAQRNLLTFAPAWLAVNAIVGLWLHHATYQMTPGHFAEGQYLVGSSTPNMLGIILGSYTVVFGLGAFIWGFFISRLGELRTMRLTVLGIAGAGAMMGLINHSGGPGPLLWIGVAGFALMVFIESGFAPAGVSYLSYLSNSLAADRGLLMGIYSVVLGLGQLTGGSLGGVFADHWAMDGVLLFTFILCAVAVVSIWALQQPVTAEREEPVLDQAAPPLPGSTPQSEPTFS